MSYQISLYHLVPWQRQATLVKEEFNVEMQHPGITKLWDHLKKSGNREIRTERLDDGNVVDLVRPIDCDYTINWVFMTEHINDIDKPRFAQTLTQMVTDKWLWFGFRKVKRDPQSNDDGRVQAC